LKCRFNIFVIALSLFPFGLLADWPTSPGSPLFLGAGSINFNAISDGQGGAYVTRGIPDVLCERLDAEGNTPWNSQLLDYLGHEVWFPSLALSSDSCMLVSYSDIEWVAPPPSEFVRTDIRVQKIDSTGNKLWGSGIVVSPPNASGDDDLALISKILGTTDGGAFIAWVDLRDGGPHISLYIQRISSAGEIMWDDYGILVSNSLARINYLFKNEDNDFSIIFRTNETDSNRAHHIQTFTEEGLEYFGIGGLELPTVAGGYYSIDGLGNLFYRYTLNHIAKINTYELPSFEWIDITLETPGETYIKSICPDENGGAFVSIYDVYGGTNSIYFQWIDSIGSLCYDEPGLFGATVETNYSVSTINSINGFISILNGLEQVAFRTNSLGVPDWDNVLLYDQILDGYQAPVTVTDNSGGAVYVFVDEEWGGVWATKISAEGVLGGTSPISVGTELPTDLLIDSYPNPFNPNTTIKYELPERSNVILKIFDINGRNIQTLVQQSQPAGHYEATWNGTDETGKQVAGGMYFARLQAGESSSVVKMVYLR